MKKIFYLAIAALAFAACARELAPEAESNLPKVKVSIKAILEQEDVTKAEINMSNGTASWEAGDQIAVHTKNGKLATLEAESAGTSVTFSGTVDAGDDIEDGAIAYYPAAIAIEGNDAKVNMPASYASAAAAAKGFPMRGVLTGDAVEFKHIGGLMKVSVNDVPSEVTSLVFTAASVAVSGELDVDVTAPKCVVGSASSSITITSAAADRAAGTAVFYIPLPTGVLTGGFSLALKNGSNDVYVKTSTNALEITRAKLFKMKAFTPALTGWFIPGGYNSWSTTATPMAAVVGHDGWLVARNINTTPVSGQDAGFKFYDSSDDSWHGVSTSVSTLHTQGSVDGSSNITFANGTYDIYFNPTTSNYFLANAGEPWYRNIFLTTDVVTLDPTETYRLHIWDNGTGIGVGTTFPGIAGEMETVSGVKYVKFAFEINNSIYPVAGTKYDFVFSNSSSSSEPGSIHYELDYGDGYGPLSIASADTENSYLTFTGPVFNGACYSNTAATQFTDPAKPQGPSNWYVLIQDPDTHYSVMEWDNGPVLVKRNVTIGPSMEITFRLTTGNQNDFYGYSGTVTPNTDFSVVHFNGERASAPKSTMPSLDGTYICDVYLDVFNQTARVVPRAKSDATITLYFGVPNPGTYVKYYTFHGGTATTWPGVEITEYEEINFVKYYKAVVPGASYWNTNVSLIIVSDGISGSQTNDFTTADWSGYKTDYYFQVVGKDIVQLPGRPDPLAITINGDMSDWAEIPFGSSNDSDVHMALKAFYDDDYIYLYSKRSTYRASDLWNHCYLYFDFDMDNDATTGDYTEGSRSGLEAFMYLYVYEGTPAAPVIPENPTGSASGTSISNVYCKGKVNSDSYEIELRIPRENLPIQKGKTMKIYSWGSKDTNTRTLLMPIPND